MQITTKVLPLLCLVFNIANIHAGAVVDDRSIMFDADRNALSHRGNSQLNNNFQNLPQSKLDNKLALNSLESDLYPDRPIVRYSDNKNSFEDENAAPVDLESVDREFKPEVPVARDRAPNLADSSGYNQELVIPNGSPQQSVSGNNQLFNENDYSKPTQRVSTAQELESLPLKSRLNRIENILESQKSSSVDSKVTALQEEVQRLRGLVEFQKHELEKSFAQQKLLVEDLDRRVNKGSREGSTLGATSEKSSAALPSAANTKPAYQDDKLNQQDLYTQAYSNIKAKNYSKAILLFNKYLTEYPNGLFGANSNYWLGEIHMIQSDYPKALAAFDNVLNKYPQNSKSADALYKKGLIHIYQKDYSKAKSFLSSVKTQYKDTTAARLADKELQTLEKLHSGA